MKTIKLTKKRMEEILPKSIKDTPVISDNAKKVLAAIMNYHISLDVVKDAGFLVCPNSVLRDSVGIRNEELLNSLQELIECDLIIRKIGQARTEGERGRASTYRVIWQNLAKPIKKKNTFETLFADFLKSSETPMGTAVSVSVSDTVSDIVNDIDSDIVNDMLCNVIEKEKNILKKEKEELDESKVNLLEEEEAFAEGKFYTREEQLLAREKADVHQYIEQQSYGMSFQDFDDKFNLKIRDYVSSKYPRDTRELFLDAMKRIFAIKSSRNEVT